MVSTTCSASPDTYLDAIYQTRGWQYAQAVVGGEILACAKARMACERFIREAHQSQSPLYPWRFDVELATRPARFMEGFFVPTKGDYDRMRLLPWQCFCEENIYGWVDRETGVRRFREALICVGRGNGKSTLIGGNATFGASKDNERGAEVGLFANSKAQAGEMLDEIGAQIADSPALAKRFKVLKSGILYEDTHSRIRTFATNPKRLAGLNLHLAIFDEIYEYRSYKLLTQVRMSHIKRRQPITFYISTKGTVLDGPLMRLYKMSQQVLAGHANPMVADRFFCFICEQESVEEFEQPDTWIKANPSLGALIDKRDLFEAWQRAKESPEERAEFITKQFNVFSNASEMPFVTDDVLERNRERIDLALLRGRICYGGYDLSLREDFTSACLLFPLDDGRFFCLSHTFVPRRKIELGDSAVVLESHLPVRVFKFVLPCGEVETLLTNLFELPESLLPELYALRWGVEVAYFKLKQELCVEKFSGKTSNSVRQDFGASFVLLNAVAVFQREADIALGQRQAEKSFKHTYRARTSDLIITLRDRFIFAVLCGNSMFSDAEMKRVITSMARSVSPIRPARSFLRSFLALPQA